MYMTTRNYTYQLTIKYTRKQHAQISMANSVINVIITLQEPASQYVLQMHMAPRVPLATNIANLVLIQPFTVVFHVMRQLIRSSTRILFARKSAEMA